MRVVAPTTLVVMLLAMPAPAVAAESGESADRQGGGS